MRLNEATVHPTAPNGQDSFRQHHRVGMSDSPEEDPLQFDSPPGAHIRSSDGVITAPSTIARKAIPGKNLNRHDDHEKSHPSNEPLAAEKEQREMKGDGCNPTELAQAPSLDLDLSFLDHSAKTSPLTTQQAMSNSLLQSFDPLIEGGRRSIGNSGTPIPPVLEAIQEDNASTKSGRHSLSALFQAWNHVLLGQSAPSPSTPLNLAGQLPSAQHSVLSPLLTHLKSGSKLSGAVASLLSPWAGRSSEGEGKDPDDSSLDAAAAAAINPADDSLADLLHGINLKDADEEEEEKEAFFSPDRGRASPTGLVHPPVFLEDTQTSILPHLERSSHSLCSSHYSDAMETIENVTGVPPAGSPPASPTATSYSIAASATEERRIPSLGLQGDSSSIEELPAIDTPRDTIPPRRTTLTPLDAECPATILSAYSSSMRDSDLLNDDADPQTTPSYHKNNTRQRFPDCSPSTAFPSTTSIPSSKQEIGVIPDVEVQPLLISSKEISPATSEYRLSASTTLPQSPSARVQSIPPTDRPEPVVVSPDASLCKSAALETEIHQLDNSVWNGLVSKSEGPVNTEDGKTSVTHQPASGDPSSYAQGTPSHIYKEAGSCLHPLRQLHQLGSRLEPDRLQFPSEDEGQFIGLSEEQPASQPLVTHENALTAPYLSSSLTQSVAEHEPSLRLITDPVYATIITSVEAVTGVDTSVLSVSSVCHHRAASSPSPFIAPIAIEEKASILETADVLSAAPQTVGTPPAGGAADSAINPSPADTYNGDVVSLSPSTATINEQEASVTDESFERTCNTVLEVADIQVTTERIKNSAHAELSTANRSVILSLPPVVTPNGEAGISSTSSINNGEEVSVIEDSSAPVPAEVTETVGVAPTTQQVRSAQLTNDQHRAATTPLGVPLTASECRSAELPQRSRRNTVTLENPLQLQRTDTRGIVEITSAVELLTTPTTEPETHGLEPYISEANVLEDKENVPPKLQHRTTGVRKSVKLADTASNTQTRQHSLTLAEKKVPSTRPRRTQPPSDLAQPEIVEKEKTQLREDIALLNALTESLRPVITSYQNTFEEAWDLKSRSYMAFASAAVQARDELLKTQSEAVTVHTALEDSNRRFLKIQENIEEKRKVLSVLHVEAINCFGWPS
uniref:Uncharacterized protein n=1 Tax=Schistocephalus solidus TaxID=70667 RepID=A0A0X3PUW5_SCHSO